ncbi:MAG: exodeoxyribonuclease VII small subunit [Chloroflexi bacterium]|nr:exodeoxyribonuclease VII small subunit [Chloroflexota bacterium]
MTEPSDSTQTRPQNGSFEKAFEQLEQSVRKLEAGQLSLAEATDLFEDGMKLAKRCNELLSTTELRVTRLQTAFAEQMRLVDDDFEPED